MTEEAIEARKNYMREYRAKNREHRREYMAEWRANHKDKIAEYNSRYWEKRAAQMQQDTEI